MQGIKNEPLKLFGIIALVDCAIIMAFQLAGVGDPLAFFFEDPRSEALRDTFMDHFNSIWLAYERGFDGSYNSIYPPLVELVYLMLGYAVIDPGATGAHGLRNGEAATTVAAVSFALVEAVIVVAIAFAIHAIARSKGQRDSAIYLGALGIVLSVPFLYSIERGNSMLFCILFLLLFAHFYPQKTRRGRILAITFFALAVNIKLYPAIFVLVYALDRRWKEAAWATVASLVLFFAPFALFSGIDSLMDFFHNLFGTTAAFSYRGYGYAVGLANTVNFTLVWLTGNLEAHVPNRIMMLLILASIAIFFIAAIKKGKSIPLWKGVLLCGCCIALFPNFSYTYNLCFLLPGAVLFLSSETLSSKQAICIFILLCLSLLSIPFNVKDMAPLITDQFIAQGLTYNFPMSLGNYLNSLGTALLWIVLTVDLLRSLIKRER